MGQRKGNKKKKNIFKKHFSELANHSVACPLFPSFQELCLLCLHQFIKKRKIVEVIFLIYIFFSSAGFSFLK